MCEKNVTEGYLRRQFRPGQMLRDWIVQRQTALFHHLHHERRGHCFGDRRYWKRSVGYDVCKPEVVSPNCAARVNYRGSQTGYAKLGLDCFQIMRKAVESFLCGELGREKEC